MEEDNVRGGFTLRSNNSFNREKMSSIKAKHKSEDVVDFETNPTQVDEQDTYLDRQAKQGLVVDHGKYQKFTATTRDSGKKFNKAAFVSMNEI